MGSVAYTPTLADEYQTLWDTCIVHRQHQRAAYNAAVQAGIHEERYGQVQIWTGAPWWWIALTHHMESGSSFNRHLHNGDPLTARTVNVPAGRPLFGAAPFNWEVSATDALKGKGIHKITDWSLPSALWQLERYNGLGYRKHHPEVLSPYLWSGTNHYRKGKYVADGRWSAKAVSLQTGACAVLKSLVEMGKVSL